MSSRGAHFSSFKQGTWKNGAWHCGHNERAAERIAERGENFGTKFWVCTQPVRTCGFWLWEDHVVDALKHLNAPEEDIVKMTPRKRKRDGNITHFFDITSKTTRTRDAEAEAEAEGAKDSDEDMYELSDREPSPSRTYRDGSPTPVSRRPMWQRDNAPSPSLGPPSPTVKQEKPPQAATPLAAPPQALAPRGLPYVPVPEVPVPEVHSVFDDLLSAQAMMPADTVTRNPQVPMQAPPRPRTPPTAPAALAPSPALQPGTPTSNSRGRMAGMREIPISKLSKPLALASPSPSKRKLSMQELDTYNTIMKVLKESRVNVSVKGQIALRNIIKEEDFSIG